MLRLRILTSPLVRRRRSDDLERSGSSSPTTPRDPHTSSSRRTPAPSLTAQTAAEGRRRRRRAASAGVPVRRRVDERSVGRAAAGTRGTVITTPHRDHLSSTHLPLPLAALCNGPRLHPPASPRPPLRRCPASRSSSRSAARRGPNPPRHHPSRPAPTQRPDADITPLWPSRLRLQAGASHARAAAARVVRTPRPRHAHEPFPPPSSSPSLLTLPPPPPSLLRAIATRATLSRRSRRPATPPRLLPDISQISRRHLADTSQTPRRQRQEGPRAGGEGGGVEGGGGGRGETWPRHMAETHGRETWPRDMAETHGARGVWACRRRGVASPSSSHPRPERAARTRLGTF